LSVVVVRLVAVAFVGLARDASSLSDAARKTQLRGSILLDNHHETRGDQKAAAVGTRSRAAAQVIRHTTTTTSRRNVRTSRR
jgi:hypothetical protein